MSSNARRAPGPVSDQDGNALAAEFDDLFDVGKRRGRCARRHFAGHGIFAFKGRAAFGIGRRAVNDKPDIHETLLVCYRPLPIAWQLYFRE